MENSQFELGQLFNTSAQFKCALRQYSIIHRKNLTLSTNEKWRVRAKCQPPCKWMIYASKESKSSTNLQVKTFNHKHTHCRHATKNKSITADWLAHTYQALFVSNPDMPWQSLRDIVKKEHKVVISKGQFYRTKMKAQELIEGTHRDQYN